MFTYKETIVGGLPSLQCHYYLPRYYVGSDHLYSVIIS